MSEINSEKAFDRAIDLVIHVDQSTGTWIVRLVFILAGLVAAQGGLLAWKGASEAIIPWLTGIIACVAIFLLWAMTYIFLKEHDYAWKYEIY